MAKLIINEVSIITNAEENCSTISLSYYEELQALQYNARITNAVLKLQIQESVNADVEAKCGDYLIDVIKVSGQKYIYINITDELIDYISAKDKNKRLGININTIQVIGSNELGDNSLIIEYMVSNEDGENFAYIKENVGRAGELSIELSRRAMKHIHHDLAVSDADKAFSISHVYRDSMAGEECQKVWNGAELIKLPKSRCGDGWHASYQQYLVKSDADVANVQDKYILVDALGNIAEFESKYYYETANINDSKNNVKNYVPKEKINISVDGKLSIIVDDVDYEIYEEQKTDSGWRLATEKTGFKGIDDVEQRTEELARLEEENKNYSKMIEDLTLDNDLMAVESENLGKQKEQLKNDRTAAKNDLEFSLIENQQQVHNNDQMIANCVLQSKILTASKADMSTPFLGRLIR